MQQKSGFLALITLKCPRCRHGNLFARKFFEAPLQFDKMNQHCPSCGVRFEKEPGFFFGAMFVSYVLNVALLLITGSILFFLFNDPPLWVYIVTVPSLVILLLPLIYRFSRAIYLYGVGDISFDKQYAEKAKVENV